MKMLDAKDNPIGWQPAPKHQGMFRSLTAAEVTQFEAYARQHDPEGDHWVVVCHPVCVAVWRERGFMPTIDV